MNPFKRAIGFGVITWVLVSVVFSIIMLIPLLAGRETAQHVIFWVCLIPIVLFAAKWYFREVPSSPYRGLSLGVTGLVARVILDLIITIPLFFAPNVADGVSAYQIFFSDVKLYIGFLWYILLAVYAGSEFDLTFTKRKRMSSGS